ncbi:MAG TPA: DEAD/DEAH box helicase [Jiangellaceae bacterium]|nr:DEAD/DEAH box helicase [Jiangellaceae bacterium]
MAETPDAPHALERFAPATRDWFIGAFGTPTSAQEGTWHTVAAGRNALVVAPTGSGKTLAAFLWELDRLASAPAPSEPRHRCRVLYVSPLKALAVDVERNLRAPLVGMGHAARRLGQPVPDITVDIRSGDTPASDRRRFTRTPADILITTPESLFLLLTSAARESLRGVETVILDEVHAVAGTKRGGHLALSLERLDAMLAEPAQRIGLSATVRPTDEVARFLGGAAPVDVVAPAAEKGWDLRVVVPVPDMGDLGASRAPDTAPEAAEPERTASIWPHVEEHVVDLVDTHRSTIVFANSRRLAERLTSRMNEIAGQRANQMAEAAEDTAARDRPAPLLARSHHGSVSKEQRALIEEDLKAGRLPAVVATSSLELGIDMGAVDLVVQVEAPPSVANGLQRVGRAGHHVGAVSRGVLFPKHRGDLLQTAVVVERMRSGSIEALAVPKNPLDVLAQQVVAMVAMEDWTVDGLLAVVRRAHPFATLPQSAFDSVLDMLSGRYPSDEFAELRPRLVWERTSGTLEGRPGVQRLAVTSGGTIPDRGLFGVYLAGTDNPSRVGELDEEMVYESRVGDVFALGASSWRIEEITHDRVLVSPAPGVPGRMPFWHGDALGRPAELGAALGTFVREVAAAEPEAAVQRLAAAGLDDWAAQNLLAYLHEQRASTGHVPDDRTLVVERFRDELGDWRMVVHSPYGGQVHAPWALAIAARLRERYGVDVQAAHSDDGIVLRIPDTGPGWDPFAPVTDLDGATSAEVPSTTTVDSPDAELVVLDADEVATTVTDELGGSALFAARFRECAARALLLPRRRPGQRSPLWQQRQRSAQLLEVASKHGSFPIVLETVRECLNDLYDLPALQQLMADIAQRRVRLVEVETSEPSPFARSMLFGYVAAFMYEGDSPLAERRAQALTLDSSLLAELLGHTELRELLSPDVLARTEAELQRLAPERQVTGVEGAADLLRLVGPLDAAAVQARSDAVDSDQARRWLIELVRSRRAIDVRIGGRDVVAAIEDAGRIRDALGVPLPVGVPDAFLEPTTYPLDELVARYARTHGPFTVEDVAASLGLGVAVVRETLQRLASTGRVAEGELSPMQHGTQWCDTEVLRVIRRRSLAELRQEVEPVDPRALARFLPAWQSVGARLRGPDGVLQVIEQLGGVAVPASAWESLVLPARVSEYNPAWLDELTSSGEVLWAGHAPLGTQDGWVSMHLAEQAALTLPERAEDAAWSGLHRAVLDVLAGGGAHFFRSIADGVRAAYDDPGAAGIDDDSLEAALWDLVWAGDVSNDTLAPLRARLAGRRGGGRGRTQGSPLGRRRSVRQRYGPGQLRQPARSGPPGAAGRWSLLPERDTGVTTRAHTRAQLLLDRHGVVTRGAVAGESVPGGFAAMYRVLSAAEEAGGVRRGYFVEGLGAAQFGSAPAIDRLRNFSDAASTGTPALLLAATDPANPFGAALPWPPAAGGHRPGRKAGAVVVLEDGALVCYLERGGRSLLTFSTDTARLERAAVAVAGAVRAGALGPLRVHRADGAPVMNTPVAAALENTGFHRAPDGLRLRG